MSAVSDLDSKWHYFNSGSSTLYLWIEPWAEGYDLPVGSHVKLVSPDGTAIGEAELAENQITIWSSSPLLEVFIDDELQESASASVPVPSELNKAMLTVMFGKHPEARLGGKPRHTEPKMPFWTRMLRRLGI